VPTDQACDALSLSRAAIWVVLGAGMFGHTPFAGTEYAVETILAEVVNRRRQYSRDGVTFSGGEPMQQAEDLDMLLQGLRSALPRLSVGMFTGYSEKELETGHYFTKRGVDQDQRRVLWRSIRSQLDFAVMGGTTVFSLRTRRCAPVRTRR